MTDMRDKMLYERQYPFCVYFKAPFLISLLIAWIGIWEKICSLDEPLLSPRTGNVVQKEYLLISFLMHI